MRKNNTPISPKRPASLPAATVLALVLLLAAGGCSPFRPAPRDFNADMLPPCFSLYSDNATATGKWWEGFGSAELNRLVETALAENLDIRQAWARLRQARAGAVQSGADRYPSLDGDAGYSHTRQRADAGSGGKKTTDADSHSLGLSAAYEVDLWGRVGAEAASGALDAQAGLEDLRASAMTVAAEVVDRWIEIQARRRERQILQEQVKANETYLELIELRFRNSLATALDVYQQRESLAKVKAQIPPVESEERVLLHELAALLGRPAGAVALSGEEPPALPPLPGVGLPADLLANRPDVRSAGLSLRSSDWAVAAARADRLPSLTLSGSGAFSGAQLATVFDNWILTLAASVAGPIFDGGYRKAEVEKARGVVDERLAAYKSAVLTAFKEVEDALTREKWQQRYIEARHGQLAAARVNLREALSRYVQGLDDYLPVLTALLSVQNLELSDVTDQEDLLLYRVSLHRALGGAWADALQPPAGSETDAAGQTPNKG
ncbi:efflux transporter outer membrane subunit [Pseudodesulfovibrio sp.]|uniref:efflux transporter outer membrane subunit n=1 Tax=Pseudodesulfovibrio sp. TaxID=2035812 RepID=UPI0026030C36|nr:efflux transporter outer membrane subunit [Pseudodesulfovibrio sp.]MDD3311159.1 efflux transporter outer membrane subunit [Pseudodesulfovibrio sp.]